MSNKPLILSLAAFAVLLSVVIALWPREETPAPVTPPVAAPAAVPGGPPLAHERPAAAPPAAPVPVGELTATDREFLGNLKQKFGPHLAGKHAQVKAIEQVVAYLKANYPADWRQRVRAFLDAAFPELADTMFAKFEGLMQHNDWLEANRDLLMKMDPAARRAALWAARREAFGAEAEEIWAAALKSEQVADALAALDAAQGMTIDEKMRSYLEAVNTAYGADGPALIANRQTELLNSFLSTKSVQEDLRALPPDQRRDTLRAVRSTMGMDEAALGRWDELDQRRDQAWDAGQQYMFQREQVLARYQGEEREQMLRQLQESMLGSDAEVVRSEEASGFFRYAHERRLGRE